jgi:GNAT superfamily N-acetyltransferase
MEKEKEKEKENEKGTIRVMTREEVLSYQPKNYMTEDWSFGMNDFACVHSFDPTAYMCYTVGGEIVASAGVVKWDETFAFAGSLLVQGNQRGKGYGSQLMQAVMKTLGDRNIGTDAMHAEYPIYQQTGFIKAYDHYSVVIAAKHIEHPLHKQICELDKVPFADFAAYDSKYCPVPRPRFLEFWIKQPDCVCHAFVSEGRLLGYGVLRPGWPEAQLGPLYAEREDIACALLSSLGNTLKVGERYELCTHTPNPHVLNVITGFGFEKRYSCTRMYNKKVYPLPAADVYACLAPDIG